MQTVEGLMTPTTRQAGEGDAAYTEVYQHVAGVPVDLINQVDDIVAHRKRSRPRSTKREVYVEAMESFLAAVRQGEKIDILATPKSGKGIQFWLREDLHEELTDVCEKLDRKKNAIFVAALSRWLDHWQEQHRP
jgi:hypothetical protein